MTYGIAPFTLADDVTPIIAAWKDAFSDPPHGHRSVHDLAEQLAWHGTFPGFTGLAARDEATGVVLGMVYGFSNRPGQWWRDRVAAVIGPDQTRELLDDSFCLMELGVMRAARRQGIAQALVNELLARQTHPRVLLSMQSDNRTGLAFYRATGWTTLVAQMSFGMGYLPYDILLHEVPHPGTSSP
jgi:ribosomal protein S18 acetylase RimI-like enzyme